MRVGAFIPVAVLFAAGCSEARMERAPVADAVQEGLSTASRRVVADPRDAGLRHQYGLALWRASRHDDAIRQLRKACELAPDSERIHLALVRVLMDTGRLDEALPLLTEAVDRWPASAAPHLLLGYLTHRKGRTEEAEQAFGQALARSGTLRERVSAHLGLGSALEKKGQQKEADKHYGLAIALEPELRQLLIKIQKERLYPAAISSERAGLAPCVSKAERKGRLEAILRQLEEE